MAEAGPKYGPKFGAQFWDQIWAQVWVPNLSTNLGPKFGTAWHGTRHGAARQEGGGEAVHGPRLLLGLEVEGLLPRRVERVVDDGRVPPLDPVHGSAHVLDVVLVLCDTTRHSEIRIQWS